MSDTCPICLSEIPEGASVCEKCGFKLIGKTTAFEPVKFEADPDCAPCSANDGVLREVRGRQKGIIFPISGDEITIGRNPNSTIFLNDMTVSRKHATIKCVDGKYIIYDEHSFNGVWVNDKSVQSKPLNFGDKIQIGSFGFIYEPKPTN